MKTLAGWIAVVMLVFPATMKAQKLSVVDVLNRVNKAVLTVDQGQFTFHDKVSKHATDDDSSHTEQTTVCFFKRNPSDSLIGYQLASFREDGYQQIYDGSQLFTIYDQTLEVTRKEEYPTTIKEQLNGFTGPNYLISTNRLLQRYNQTHMAQYIRLLGLDYFSGEKCYKLAIVNSQDPKRPTESYYYVSANSFLPLKTVIILTSTVGNAKERLIFDYSITSIQKERTDSNQFSREKLSDYKIEKIYTASEEDAKNELLPIGSTAPNWKLPLLGGNTMELTDLKGKIVVMDFWFKACAPCQKQMVALQTLHEKFSSDEVVIVGINTIDDPEKDRLNLFLQKRLITMPTVYKGKSIESLYKVYGSPALFVIDKKGMIIYTASGYSPTLPDDVEKVISRQLQH